MQNGSMFPYSTQQRSREISTHAQSHDSGNWQTRSFPYKILKLPHPIFAFFCDYIPFEEDPALTCIPFTQGPSLIKIGWLVLK
jgi:hypothetical protein